MIRFDSSLAGQSQRVRKGPAQVIQKIEKAEGKDK